MRVDPEVTRLKGRLAMHKRWHPEDEEGIAERQAALDRANFRHLIQRTPLSHEEIAEIVEKEIMTI